MSHVRRYFFYFFIFIYFKSYIYSSSCSLERVGKVWPASFSRVRTLIMSRLRWEKIIYICIAIGTPMDVSSSNVISQLSCCAFCPVWYGVAVWEFPRINEQLSAYIQWSHWSNKKRKSGCDPEIGGVQCIQALWTWGTTPSTSYQTQRAKWALNGIFW